jgi:hypothetical protein
MILGLCQGATENATVVGELLGDLMNRGLGHGGSLINRRITEM